jgi:hypothetical protein
MKSRRGRLASARSHRAIGQRLRCRDREAATAAAQHNPAAGGVDIFRNEMAKTSAANAGIDGLAQRLGRLYVRHGSHHPVKIGGRLFPEAAVSTFIDDRYVECAARAVAVWPRHERLPGAI